MDDPKAKLWRAKGQRVKAVHVWRPRRSRFGVNWCSGTLARTLWLEGRGEKLYLIATIDDATSRLLARFVRHDSTEEEHAAAVALRGESSVGRLASIRTRPVSSEPRRSARDEVMPRGRSEVEMPPTQIGRALQELEIAWIPAHTAAGEGLRFTRTSSVRATTTCVTGNRLAYRTPAAGRDGFSPKCSYNRRVAMN